MIVTADARNLYALSSTYEHSRVLAFARNRRSGRLTQLSGRAGCVASRAGAGCAVAPSLAGEPFGIYPAPDGRTLVVPTGQGLTILAREPKNGGVATRSCFSSRGRHGCAALPVWGLETNTVDVLFAADGRSVYVTASGNQDDATGGGAQGFLLSFARDPATGTLTPTPTPTGCLEGAEADFDSIPACTSVANMTTMLVAPVLSGNDVMSVATSGIDDDEGALLQLRRDPASGVLAATPTACWRAYPAAGCMIAAGLRHPVFGPIISPDGRNAYVGTFNSTFGGTPINDSAIVSLQRDPQTGRLSPLPGRRGCLTGLRDPSCGRLAQMLAPVELALSRDGRNAYVWADWFGRVLALRRRSDGSLAPLRGHAACYARRRTASCERADGIERPALDMVISDDGRFVYAFSAGIAVFRRGGA